MTEEVATTVPVVAEGKEEETGAPGVVRSTRVYVGNLPWNVSWQDLKDYMRKAGEVTHADVFRDESGRSRGCGVVEYSTPEMAQTAIETLNNSKINDTERLIFVREDREDRNFASSIQRNRPYGGGAGAGGFGGGAGAGGNYADRDRGRKIFIGNLPYNVSWQDLKDRFRDIGTIIRADILTGPDGRSKGQGTILFESPAEAEAAIQKHNGSDFNGRNIDVRLYKFKSYN